MKRKWEMARVFAMRVSKKEMKNSDFNANFTRTIILMGI